MPKPPIVVIKRVKGHGVYHGGAWKVAYADFVTAMMALFIVLWLMNTSDHVKKAVAGYFNDPLGRPKNIGTSQSGNPDAPAFNASEPFTKENVEKLKDQLQKQIQQSANLKDLSKQVEMTVTPEGLKIELLESKDGTFFASGSAELNEKGKEMLNLLAAKLSTVPNKVSIEGHTDSAPFAEGTTYSNWELSEDRANVARRLMQHPNGLRSNQVSQVRGFADQQLRTPRAPFDPSNRRISLIVQYETSQSRPARTSFASEHGPITAQQPVSGAPPAKR